MKFITTCIIGLAFTTTFGLALTYSPPPSGKSVARHLQDAASGHVANVSASSSFSPSATLTASDTVIPFGTLRLTAGAGVIDTLPAGAASGQGGVTGEGVLVNGIVPARSIDDLTFVVTGGMFKQVKIGSHTAGSGGANVSQLNINLKDMNEQKSGNEMLNYEIIGISATGTADVRLAVVPSTCRGGNALELNFIQSYGFDEMTTSHRHGLRSCFHSGVVAGITNLDEYGGELTELSGRLSLPDGVTLESVEVAKTRGDVPFAGLNYEVSSDQFRVQNLRIVSRRGRNSAFLILTFNKPLDGAPVWLALDASMVPEDE